jgi:transcriptional regulator with PAS, ATPase and Fis domain
VRLLRRKVIFAFRHPCFTPLAIAYSEYGVPGAMTPRLLAIDGPLKGLTFAISGESFSIGRKSGNTIAVADASASRKHCLIRPGAGGEFIIVDLASQNGTFVNGRSISEHALVHGDRIRAGASVFVFLLEEENHQDDSAPTELIREPRQGPSGGASLRHGIIGGSPAIQRVLDFISRAAPLDSTVLISGESGTGKELVAQALHENSPRASKPFLAINCAALSETFLESELFGHERGAFTGAVAQKKGKLELADGGTLFLDEIGELALPLQGKLLRVLQYREFHRLGGTRAIKTDLRLVAATNRDLEAAVREGGFRQDLFFRLHVLALVIPPLRQRREDIPQLAEFFRARHSARLNRQVSGISASALECLLSRDWPGNVRELESAIESAVALGSTELITPDDLPPSVLPSNAPEDLALPNFNQALTDTKRELILKAYQHANGDYLEAARALGLHPNSLLRLVRTLDLKPSLRR